ncbi:hypothetical protein RclHR1_08310003 [Rhizophagus clarus]|uniref:F-box domain-containing protein n=1 Tax=Rhizophagus clarus TaxID=94130 RepID=A0A2Z6SBK5_9GLOM|nr:hypothetical protein RclHR1_08310003 [Rhizophagus clarus]GES91091.1 hypothetical protein GLOIN_2v1877448 [Rhizophagus clarus]
MTCSKIFLGDLPELTSDIIHHFKYDYKTLHSCILVNRLWCKLAIPLLWEDPFSIKFPKNYHFIEIYLHNLNEADKTKLNEYGINVRLFPSNTLFNYSSFIKCLNTYTLIFSVEKWVGIIKTLNNDNLNTNFDQNLNIIKLVYKSLFKIFIDNEASLHTFEIEIITQKDCDYFEISLELILQNPNFIHDLKILDLYFFATIISANSFLKFLYLNCNLISSLYFQFPIFNDDNISIEKYLSQIINSQKNLKKILFGDSSNLSLYNSLSSLKNSNCSNTLNTIIFFGIDFKNITILKEVLDQLIVLESIHILYCLSLNSNFIQQIINMTRPFKLRSLFNSEFLQIDESLELLLQKSGDYLENLGLFGNGLNQQLLELIIKFCFKIKFLDLSGVDNININSILNLIKNLNQNLYYLSIHQSSDDLALGSIILRKLGQIIPLRLEYLSLTLMINPNDFEIFLKNSQNVFIKKLLLRNKIQEKTYDILPYIKDYVMKENRVKYLAFEEINFENYISLSSLKAEVKEFNLYNIKILSFDELNIDCYNFVKEMY